MDRSERRFTRSSANVTLNTMANKMPHKLFNITECSICTGKYNNPRILPCVHTFCLQCVKGFTKDQQPGDKSSCPLCRRSFEIPQEGVESLPRNFFVEELKEIAGTSNESCDECGSNKTDLMYCLSCRGNLCETCVEKHKQIKLTQAHELVKRDDERVAKPREHFCSKHNEEVVKVWCRDCKEALCTTCFVVKHQSHDRSDVNEIADELRTQLSNRAQDVNVTVSSCNAITKKLRENQKNFDENVAEVEREINRQVEWMKSRIEKDKQKLLDELASHKTERQKVTDSLIETVDQHIAIADNLSKYAEELRLKGSSTDVALQVSSLLTRTGEVMKLDAIIQSVTEAGSERLSLTAATELERSAENIVGYVNKKHVPETLAADPSVTHVIPAGGGRGVVGVTSVKNQLFVLRTPSEQEIAVYDTKTFTLQRKLRVDGLSDSNMNSLTSCMINNCLYVGDCSMNTVNKVELTGSDQLSKWKVGSGLIGLSVNTACNVLVTCSNDSDDKILEYTTGGQLIRETKIKDNDNCDNLKLLLPVHSIELTSSQFVVCHHGPLPGDVIVVDKEGRLVVSYKNNKQSTDRLMNYPRYLAVGKNDCILVADSNNNRIVMLNSSLSFAQDLPMPYNGERTSNRSVFGSQFSREVWDGVLNRPRCLHFDESRGRVFVGEYNGKKRVVVIDNVLPFFANFK